MVYTNWLIHIKVHSDHGAIVNILKIDIGLPCSEAQMRKNQELDQDRDFIVLNCLFMHCLEMKCFS